MPRGGGGKRKKEGKEGGRSGPNEGSANRLFNQVSPAESEGGEGGRKRGKEEEEGERERDGR